MQAPSLPQGSMLSRTARRYRDWHIEKPIRPQHRHFIYRMLVAGLTLVVLGFALILIGVAFSVGSGTGLFSLGLSLAFVGASIFTMGHAYRRRGKDVLVSPERRIELATLVIFAEFCGLCGIIIGLWSGAFI